MKYPWMPMFWGDFFANTLHLSAQEIGAYVCLIAHAWEHEGKIEVRHLLRVSRVTPRHWPKVRHQLEPFFRTTEIRQYWVHHRVLDELAKAGEISNKRKDAALQMHSKRTASASVLHMHPPSPSIEKLPNGKGSEAASVQKQGMSRDQGNDYRSPPRTKSSNTLEPTHLVAAKRSTSEE
jgi:uncharacterized protein YdaU (DUF1376 family)